MIKRVQLRGTLHKEAENTQKKLEKEREDIKKEEKQTQGLSAESDKTNKEKLKATLHTLSSYNIASSNYLSLLHLLLVST
jgi:Skp family chaperone for outer membrane proteins